MLLVLYYKTSIVQLRNFNQILKDSFFPDFNKNSDYSENSSE